MYMYFKNKYMYYYITGNYLSLKILTSDVCDLGHINANLYNRIKI